MTQHDRPKPLTVQQTAGDQAIQIGVAHVHPQPSSDPLTEAHTLIKRRHYDAARRKLGELTTADAHYYTAIALLKGLEPRRLPLQRITHICDELALACALEPAQPHYYMLWGWVQHDVAEGYRFYTPTDPDLPTLIRHATTHTPETAAIDELCHLCPGIQPWLTAMLTAP